MKALRVTLPIQLFLGIQGRRGGKGRDTDTETLEFSLRPTSPAVPISYDPALVFCLILEPETMPVSLRFMSMVAENIITKKTN